MTHFIEKFKRDIMGLLWAAAAAFLALALFSYHPTDPSLNSIGHSAAGKIANLCGAFGSYLSDILYQLLGVASWLFVAAWTRLAVRSFQGRDFKFKSWSVVWGLLLVVFFASLLGLHFPQTKIFSGQILLGGVLGAVLSRGLVTIFNPVGVGLILWTGFTVLVIFYTEKRLSEIFPWLGTIAQKISAALAVPMKRAHQLLERPVEKAREELKIAAAQTVRPMMDERPRFALFEKGPLVSRPEVEAASKKKRVPSAPSRVENWQLPPLELLHEAPSTHSKFDEKEITRNARLVEQKLNEFDVHGQVVEVRPGPAVTMYEFKPAAATKINEITKLADDLSLALSAESLRIIAPIPGRDVVGIETSNTKREPIYMRELVDNSEFWSEDIKLPITVGKNVAGESKIIDLRKIPHLLVAGTTGSGKSVFIMSLVTSLIMRHSPKTLRLIIVDPKQVDLSAFHKIPHLLLPPVKEARPAVNTLKWLIREMEKRYRSMSKFGSKNIESFNTASAALSAEEIGSHDENNRAMEADPQLASQSYYFKPQPYIVVVIEEFADLMSVDRAGVEPTVVRLAQMARASGIHLVIAMQSPRREVLTGLIKTNFPGRISFKVASKVDSTIILDQRGAERLLSVGDMLYLAPGVSQPQRYHGAFLKDEEMTAITEFWMKQGEPEYNTTAQEVMESNDIDETFGAEEAYNPDNEEGYDEVVAFVASQKEVSASLLQRRFRFGYPKAARLIEILERQGVVSPSNGSKPRVVLANKLD